MNEEGRKQQSKLKELFPIAERLGCTLPQLAVGKEFGGSPSPPVPYFFLSLCSVMLNCVDIMSLFSLKGQAVTDTLHNFPQ